MNPSSTLVISANIATLLLEFHPSIIYVPGQNGNDVTGIPAEEAGSSSDSSFGPPENQGLIFIRRQEGCQFWSWNLFRPRYMFYILYHVEKKNHILLDNIFHVLYVGVF